MLNIYGSLMPLRILEEVRFWKTQEKEHTVVLREILPQLEPDYVRLMQEWESVFAQTEAVSQQWIEAIVRTPLYSTNPSINVPLHSLVHSSIVQSQRWVQQLFMIESQSQAVKTNSIAPIVIKHIILESEYFLGVLHAMPLPAGGSNLSRSDSEPPARISSATPNEDIPLTATGEGAWSTSMSERSTVPIGGHRLPPLPYSYDALEPYIDTETMRLHHDKHHQSYVNGLNTAENELAKARQSDHYALIKHWERELAFNGAGHYLHTIFWNIMSPKGGGKATGQIAVEINKAFGSFEQFMRQFSSAADKVEGGGWAILVWSPRSHRVEILQAEKHQNLSQWDVIPLLVLDVWEHAYYLKYKNDRSEYIKAWWNVVHWKQVNERLDVARLVRWRPF